MVEKLDQVEFLFSLNKAVRQFILSKNKLRREDSSRDVNEVYKSLIDGTSREAMEIAIRLELIPESERISGPDNTLTSTIELAAIMETWGPLTALQMITLHGYLHAAYDFYLIIYANYVERAKR